MNNFEIFNEFIKDDIKENENSNPKEENKDKDINKNIPQEVNKLKPEEKEEDKRIRYKLLQSKNNILMKQLREKEKILRDYKKLCAEKSKKIEELKKIVTDNILKQAIDKDNNQIKYEQKKEKDEININTNLNKDNVLTDLLGTITFNIDDTTFFQCGICMDSFRENEKIKRLPCEHIFHTDCMNQWLQTKKTCPFCDQAIFY